LWEERGSLCDRNITAENLSYIWSNHETRKIFFYVILGNSERTRQTRRWDFAAQFPSEGDDKHYGGRNSAAREFRSI